jgi:hypothetical protein
MVGRYFGLAAGPGNAMSLSPMRALLVALLFAVLPGIASAQTIPKEKGPARVFGQFHFFCLKHLPDLDGVERAAGFGEYDQLWGNDLAPYLPDRAYEKFVGWRYHDHGEPFILTAMRAKPDDTLKAEMPAFAKATETSCALRVPNNKTEGLLGELTRALGRAPDKTWQEGATRVYSWTHQAAGALSRIQFHVPDNAAANAKLSASVYSNK